ncbi:MAG TPA: M28 family peptidase [Terriglobales bacterium]|nr:M28 family peptidase [Terriglobales bacterium]
MKKPVLAVLLVGFLTLSLSSQVPPQPQPKPEDLAKNLVLVEKAQSAPDFMKAGFESITAKNSIAMLSYLASDLLEGRETGTRGYQLAAEYAASLFALWQLKPAGDLPARNFGRRMMGAPAPQSANPPEKTYLQDFALQETVESSSQMAYEVHKGDLVKTHPFLPGVDYSSMFSTGETLKAPVIFVGYGIQEKSVAFDEFKNLDVKGKIVLVISEAPGRDNPDSPFQKTKDLKDKYFPQMPTGMPMMMMMGGQRFNKITEIAKLGPAAILQVQNGGKDVDFFKSQLAPKHINDDRPINTRPRRRLTVPGAAPMPFERSSVITITHEMADALLEPTGMTLADLQKRIDTTFKPASMAIPGAALTIATTVKSQFVRGTNVIGYIEGSDPKLKDEYVIIGAHLDHLGAFDQYVYNGADDNGSGSVGVLNAARAFAMNPERPKRSVVFCLWTGEEEGLLGSRYYTMNPEFPVAKTVDYLNLDMISRPYTEQTMAAASRMFNFPGGQDLIKKVHPANFLTVSFTTASGINDIVRSVDQYIGLDIFMREAGTQERGGGGSDHASFGAVKVPYFYAMAAMTDDYHQTSDSVDKVSGDLIAKVSQLTYATAYLLANR